MVYIILSILSSSSIFVLFKLINKKNLPLANVITLNYITAYFAGQAIDPNNPVKALNEEWIWAAAIIGILFIIFFFIIGISSKLAGIAITTVASKMSVIIPILFSIVFFKEEIVAFKIIGILLALMGVFLTVYQKSYNNTKLNIWTIVLPLILFIGMGLVDSLINYTEDVFLKDDKAFFTSSLFGISFITGLSYTLTSKKLIQSYLNKDIYFFGFLLGIVNFGSIYFLIKGLEADIFEKSVFFGINNVGIVVLSVLLGVLLFKEKISNINIIGILSSILAISTLSIA